MQTSQTGGQMYSNTFPFSIPKTQGSNPANPQHQEKMALKKYQETLKINFIQ